MSSMRVLSVSARHRIAPCGMWRASPASMPDDATARAIASVESRTSDARSIQIAGDASADVAREIHADLSITLDEVGAPGEYVGTIGGTAIATRREAYLGQVIYELISDGSSARFVTPLRVPSVRRAEHTTRRQQWRATRRVSGPSAQPRCLLASRREFAGERIRS